MLRKFLLATTAMIALGATAASAADLPRPMYTKAPPLVAPVVDEWTGLYVGVNIGYGWGSASVTDGGLTGSENLDGVLGGGQIGYNWQQGAWVLGVEVDGQGTDQHANFSGTVGPVTVTESDKLPWFMTARGRIGYAVAPSWMLYATGGLAVADFSSTIAATGLGSATWEVTRAGWTLGAGVEGRINRQLSWKLEYLHIDTGTFNSTAFGVVPVSVRLTDDIGRVGLNWRF